MPDAVAITEIKGQVLLENGKAYVTLFLDESTYNEINAQASASVDLPEGGTVEVKTPISLAHLLAATRLSLQDAVTAARAQAAKDET
jgi:hypothetical protein